MDTEAAESVLSRFLSANSNNKNKFHVQGWRWHTLSLIRDTNRLEKLALKLLSCSTTEHAEEVDFPEDAIESAAQHVIDFNMKGLHRIENELFFPWLKQRLQSTNPSGEDEDEVGEALVHVLNELERERDFVSKLGTAVREQSRVASSPSISPSKRLEVLSNIAQMSAALTSRTRGIMERQDAFLVPSVSILVPENEQKSFNNKVIRKLGIFDSRLHLVGMYDAVQETNDEGEKQLFEEVIPYIPRMMIPRWRKNLYLPQAGVLDSY